MLDDIVYFFIGYVVLCCSAMSNRVLHGFRSQLLNESWLIPKVQFKVLAIGSSRHERAHEKNHV